MPERTYPVELTERQLRLMHRIARLHRISLKSGTPETLSVRIMESVDTDKLITILEEHVSS